MIKTVEEEGCKWYMLDEEEYCEYQCLKEKAREWNSILCDAKDTIKSMRRRTRL